ncbi:MAG: M20/M25/M40 family metallo-hydrolase [Rhodospirillales bacterium]|nr:MAG: M20/M25/M40 family metallo-hydrolase [Rhodospirillales bacterium]
MTPRRSNAFDPEEILAGILDWVGRESPTFDAGAVNAMMDVAAATMRGLGAAIERVAGVDGYGDVVLARVPGRRAGPGILVLGHLDTVHPVGTVDGALPIRRDGDRVYGPGIFDMKGGMYLAVHALRETQRQGGGPELPVTFMFVPDEEVGSPSTRALIEAEARAHRHVLVPEPGRPGNTVVTGRHAFLRFTVTTHGRPAHAGSTNRDGRSAIRAMAGLIEAIERRSDFARGVTYSVGVVSGGRWVNVIPIECSAQVLAVAPTPEAFDEVVAFMTGLAGDRDGVRVEVARGPVRPLFAPHPGTMALYERAREISRGVGVDLAHGQFGGGSDGNFTGALGVPTLDGLGVLGGGAHTHEEHLLVSSLEPRARLMAGLLETLT